MPLIPFILALILNLIGSPLQILLANWSLCIVLPAIIFVHFAVKSLGKRDKQLEERIAQFCAVTGAS